MKVTDKHILFWRGWPSNWSHAEFDVEMTVNGENRHLHFYNSEQYFMFIKAITFNDFEIAEKILATSNPETAKTLGRNVKNYDDKTWNSIRYKVMVDANKYKYSQNEKLKNNLLDETNKNKKYVEASLYDRVWGIGISEEYPEADDETKWKGQNLLGKALDEVREWLTKQNY